MNLTKFALKRPVAIIVSLLALVVFGASSMLSTPLELAPNMEMPMYIISTVYPGASPDEVDSLVTTKIEEAVSTLSGLKTVESQSSENMSMVMLQLEYGTEMNRTYSDLQKKLDVIGNSLPDTTTTPTVFEMSMNSMPVLVASVSGKADMDLLGYIDENIKPEFEKLSGVASVSVSGGQQEYIQVKLLPEKLDQYGLDMNAIASSIASADFSLPAGKVDQGDLSLALRGEVSYDTPALLATVPITLRTGDIIHLSDVAQVTQTKKEIESISRYNGEDTVTIGISKRDSAATIAVTKSVNQVIDRINAADNGITMDVIMDTSENIYSSLSGVVQAMALAIVISMLILYIFLGDIKASLVVGTSMPISVLATLIIMSFAGYTFNMLSLGGLTIGVGMMVDNSIVVLDSCFKEREKGRTFKKAALEGARIVTSAVVASTITTVVVFLPIALLKGMSGQMFGDVGMTIVISLLASLISAITLVPLLFFRFQPAEKQNTYASRFLAWVNKGYSKIIRKSFRHKKSVVAIAVVLLIVSFMMLPAIGVELMPATDSGQITVSVKTKPGARLEKTEEVIADVEKIVLETPDIEKYSLSGGGGGMFGGSSSSASFSVYLKADRAVKTAEVVDLLREQTRSMVDCEVQVSSASGMGMSMGGSDQVVVNLIGNDRDQLAAVSQDVKARMGSHESVITVSSSLLDGNPQAEIVVDPVKAGAVGLAPKQIISTVNSMLNGKEAATLHMGTNDYKVRVEYPPETYRTLNDASGIILTAPSGQRVPLLDVAHIEYSNSPQAISRHNNQYTVEVKAQIRSQNAAKVNAEVTALAKNMELPSGVEHYLGGQAEMMGEEFRAILGALATAIFLIFMVMAIQFESIRFSLMVMFAIPFSLIGAFGGLLISNTTISMTSLMGLIMLMGIVVNNAIVLIDYVNQLRESGMDVKDALIEAGCTRLRPILMTTLTTVLGMVPMAIGIGENKEMMRGMAMVIIGGLSASTLLTLVLIPTLYLMLAGRDIKKTKYKQAEELDAMIDAAESKME